MSRAFDRRVLRLELRRRSPRGLFFLAWGRTDEEVEQRLAEAEAAGLLCDGYSIICAVWLGQAPMPQCRWIEDKIIALARDEFEQLGNIVERAYPQTTDEPEAPQRHSDPKID